MPIKPEQRKLYGPNWSAISIRIRRDRARGRCECTGQCGIDHTGGGRCEAINGGTTPAGSRIVLTVAHLDHDPTNHSDGNLLALCQGCHLRLDRDQHVRNARATREQAKLDAGQLALFGGRNG